MGLTEPNAQTPLARTIEAELRAGFPFILRDAPIASIAARVAVAVDRWAAFTEDELATLLIALSDADQPIHRIKTNRALMLQASQALRERVDA